MPVKGAMAHQRYLARWGQNGASWAKKRLCSNLLCLDALLIFISLPIASYEGQLCLHMLLSSIEVLRNVISSTDHQVSAAAGAALAGLNCSCLLARAAPTTTDLAMCASATCRTPAGGPQSFRCCMWIRHAFYCKATLVGGGVWWDASGEDALSGIVS